MFKIQNLDQKTRGWMVYEFDRDSHAGRLYDASPLLTEEGREDYPSLLREAVMKFDHEWLINALLTGERIVTSEQIGNDTTEREVLPQTVKRLVLQEFNRFYCRAICQRASVA